MSGNGLLLFSADFGDGNSFMHDQWARPIPYASSCHFAMLRLTEVRPKSKIVAFFEVFHELCKALLHFEQRTEPCFARLCARTPSNRATHECPRCNIQSETPQSAFERLSAPRSSDTTVVALQTLVGAILVIVDDRAVGRNESSLGEGVGA